MINGMKYIGIDYGTKKIGVAVSDSDGTLAFPKKVIANRDTTSAVENVRILCVSEKIDEIVIGDSRDYHGRPNEIMKEIEAFSTLLQEELKLPVHFELEFMSSAQASRGASGKKISENKRNKTDELKGNPTLLDASAAAVILQSFLDKNKSKKLDK